MHIVRTIIWLLLLAALLVFSFANWGPIVTVRIWPGLVVDTKIPVIVTIAFLIGFLPTWLYLRGAKWQLKRRISSLEQAARHAAGAVPAYRTPTPDSSADSTLAAETEIPLENRPPLV